MKHGPPVTLTLMRAYRAMPDARAQLNKSFDGVVVSPLVIRTITMKLNVQIVWITNAYRWRLPFKSQGDTATPASTP